MCEDALMEAYDMYDQSWISYWEGQAGSGLGRYITDAERTAIDRAHRLAGTPTTALDIGCGKGQWSKFLSDLGWGIVCTDIDERNLVSCKNLVPTATCIRVDPHDQQLPCAAESMGLVLCIEVSPVIQTDWFIGETARVLRTGGYVVGVLLNRLSWRGLVRKSAYVQGEKYTWYRFSYPAWRKQLRASGFSVVYQEGCCWVPFKRTSDSPFIQPAIRVERFLRLRKLVGFSPYVVFVARKESASGHLARE